MSRLRTLASMWSFVSYARGVYQFLVSQYQALVSEFAEELLAAECYYQGDPDFWVGSGLVVDSDAQIAIFEAARLASSNFEGVLVPRLPNSSSSLIKQSIASLGLFSRLPVMMATFLRLKDSVTCMPSLRLSFFLVPRPLKSLSRRRR